MITTSELFQLPEEVLTEIKTIYPINEKTKTLSGITGEIKIILSDKNIFYSNLKTLAKYPNYQIDYCKEKNVLLIKHPKFYNITTKKEY